MIKGLKKFTWFYFAELLFYLPLVFLVLDGGLEVNFKNRW